MYFQAVVEVPGLFFRVGRGWWPSSRIFFKVVMKLKNYILFVLRLCLRYHCGGENIRRQGFMPAVYLKRDVTVVFFLVAWGSEARVGLVEAR